VAEPGPERRNRRMVGEDRNSGGGITDYFTISGISSTYKNTNTTDPTICW
jgi:hypothetical protein